MAKPSYTWLGHATFTFRSPSGKRLILDPWLAGNPSCPDSAQQIGPLDLMLLTHGHSDHTSDAVALARSTGCRVVAPFELSVWMQRKGIQQVTGMNPGGTLKALGLEITMVPAVHSSSGIGDAGSEYMGIATGYVVRFEDGTTLYCAGDTSVFGDMRLIAELYRPTVAILPIGDLFTMGPREAAKACELLNVTRVIPMHYGTFPVLTGTPEELQRLVGTMGVEVVVSKPGEARDL